VLDSVRRRSFRLSPFLCLNSAPIQLVVVSIRLDSALIQLVVISIRLVCIALAAVSLFRLLLPRSVSPAVDSGPTPANSGLLLVGFRSPPAGFVRSRPILARCKAPGEHATLSSARG
jgi:hypothetical protein